MTVTLLAALGGPNSTSDLYSVDPATAAMTSIGPLGFALTGLAQDPTDGTIYGLTSTNSTANPRSLISVDPTTGAGTFIAALSGTGLPYTDIAFDAAGVLYAMGQGRRLATINKVSGAVTVVGVIGTVGAFSGGGMSIDSGGVGYTAPTGLNSASPIFYSFVPATAFYTNLGSIIGYPGPFNSAGLNAASFDALDVFYGVGSQAGGINAKLITIDTTTLAFTVIGSLTDAVDALCWADFVTTSGDFSVSLTPSSLTISAGGSDSTDLETTITSGVSQSVALSDAGAPSGVTLVYADNPITSSDLTAVTVYASPLTVPGSYSITISAVGDFASHDVVLDLDVVAHVPSVLRYGDPPLWRLIVTDLESKTLTVLDKRATERGMVFALNQPASTTGLVPSDDPEINIPAPDPESPAFLSHNTRLIYGLRRETRPSPGDDPYHCRLGTIVMQVDDVGADTPTSRYTAYDPWAYLMCRPIRQNDGTFAPEGGIVYSSARASDMALDLLANTLTIDGPVFIDASDSSLIEDTDVIPGDTVFDRGISVGEAWSQLCETGTIDIYLNPVYDPVNRPGILCELVIAKQYGQVQYDAVMGWDRASRSLTDLSRLIDGTRLANQVQFFAGRGGSPVALQSDADSLAAYGAYWAQQFMVGKQTQTALVVLLALAQLQIRKNGAKSISFSPAPERSYLALRDYGLGDYVPVWASRSFREPLGVDYASLAGLFASISGPPVEGETLTGSIIEESATAGGVGYLRLYAIPIELDDNGVERPRDLLTASESANSF